MVDATCIPLHIPLVQVIQVQPLPKSQLEPEHSPCSSMDSASAIRAGTAKAIEEANPAAASPT
ncbi:hypothetical protein RRF57_002531 [Xylaria bambusicola]|uniref:Uncharacterized protein n=1 Tax=Xylaria bambusicola TaxID=326684 RepID=A0AAN7UKF5_9PEZI